MKLVKKFDIEDVNIIRLVIIAFRRSFITLAKQKQVIFDFNDNKIAALIFGEGDKNIKYMKNY